MNSPSALGTEPADPAAVFAIAHSLWEACQQKAAADHNLQLSACYDGIDGLMREIMRVATQFEAWACRHVAFDEMDSVWPYFLQANFGKCCLALISADALTEFYEPTCLLVAMRLKIPVRLSEALPLPIDLRVANPVAYSDFVTLRIQTMHRDLENEEVWPFIANEIPFNDNYDPPFFSLFGLSRTGDMVHIADRKTYMGARSLAQKIAPGIAFPASPIFSPPPDDADCT